MGDFFWIGMELGFGFYCAVSLTDFVTSMVMKIFNRRKEVKE